jgi:hypothetical protein
MSERPWLRAFVYIPRALRNAVIDLRSGTPLAGGWRRPGVESVAHENSDHVALRRIFRHRIRQGDVLVDIGCGRGRVLNHWLSYHPGHRIVGIEIDAECAARTAQRLRGRPDCTVLTGDANELLPENGTLFFMYNPFGAPRVDALRERLEALPATKPAIRLLYHNPKHLDVFEDRDRWRIERIPLGGGRSAPYDDLAVIDRIG